MKIQELIKELQAMEQNNPDADVRINIRVTTESKTDIWVLGEIQAIYSPKPKLIVMDSLN